MKLTAEQKLIIQSDENIKINAVAGSGKTTTLIAYAQSRKPDKRILYLAFNKSVKLEAMKRFQQCGLMNVKVETAHSLAYRHIVPAYGFGIKPQGYSSEEIVELLKLKNFREKHTEYIIANHINKFLTYYCNSIAETIDELDYRQTVTDPDALTFVNNFYRHIFSGAKLMLRKMESGEISIIHDFYLKKFQLSNPNLSFDYILFDEGQDASPAMLNIFLKQKAIKVIVGDTHQQIYSWRYAVNSMEATDFKLFKLTRSFRFSQQIADMAMRVLQFKQYLNYSFKAKILGKGSSVQSTSTATLARTNLALLLRAIQYVTENKDVQYLYFEGNFHSYTYADEGASLYDILHLYNHRKGLIRNKLIKTMANISELEFYIKKTEDTQLAMMLNIVKEYGNRIPGILNMIKKKQVSDGERDKAEMIFSTVHRCKGMEYDVVYLADDFITEKQIASQMKNIEEKEKNIPKLNEEINLLYVAITRTKNILYIPPAIVPGYVLPSEQVRIVMKSDRTMFEEYLSEFQSISKEYGSELSWDDMHRIVFLESLKWSEKMDIMLTDMVYKGVGIKEMVRYLKKPTGVIRERIKVLGLAEHRRKNTG